MINGSTLQFLTDLALNNDRSWFQDNKPSYASSREDILVFTSTIIKGLAAFDETIPPDLKATDCVMRIYRDVRFSKNKAPYKNNFGIGISANGKNFDGPGYYIHIQPGKSFVGGGTWMPGNDQLKKIRQEIDYNGTNLLEIIHSPAFSKTFGALSTEDKLKSAPKGYDADNPMLEHLKLKSFTAGTSISDKMLQSPDAPKRIVDMFETLNPLLVFLRNAIA